MLNLVKYYLAYAIYYVNLVVLAPVIVFSLFNATTGPQYDTYILGLFWVLLSHIGFGYVAIPDCEAAVKNDRIRKKALESVTFEAMKPHRMEVEILVPVPKNTVSSMMKKKINPEKTCKRCSGSDS